MGLSRNINTIFLVYVTFRQAQCDTIGRLGNISRPVLPGKRNARFIFIK